MRPTLGIAFGITALFMIAEIIGGLLTHSLALLADAVALALSLLAVWLARRPTTPRRSFGFYRAEVLAALVNAAALIIVSIFIFKEAYARLWSPPEVNSIPMLMVAVGGLVANLISAWVLTRGGGHKHNLNTRSAFLHVIGDLLGSVGAIIAAIIMLLTGWYQADPILSALIGLLVLRGAWKVLIETLNVLMEITPSHIDIQAVHRKLQSLSGVRGLHDLHIWTVTSGFVALSAHVEIIGNHNWNDLLVQASEILNHEFGIVHMTLQPEVVDPESEIVLGCALNTMAPPQTCTVAPQSRPNSQHSH